MKSLDQEDYIAKDKAFYNAMIGAWLNTKLERDKQLLGLSVTAIGLLVTLLRTVGAANLLQKIFFCLALFTFLITVVSVIFVLQENSTHIERLLNNHETESNILKILDRAATSSFILGIILVVIIGVNSALNVKEVNMSKERSLDTQPQPISNKDSWNGVSKLRPQPPKATQTPPHTPPTNNPSTPSMISSSNNSPNVGESDSSS